MPAAPESGADHEAFAFSIIVPAHNEASRGFSVLETLEAAAEQLGARVIVVCNGCSDNTAAVARRVKTIEVEEISVASKSAALNAGDDLAGDLFPRLYLDADIRITVDALEGIVKALAGDGGAIAGPERSYLLDDAPWLVRRYYAALAEIPFLVRLSSDLMIGRGLYAVNAAGRARFERFPALTADDGFIDRLFDPDEKHVVAGATAGIPVPDSVQGFIRAKTRAAAGTKELVSYIAVHRPDRLVVEGTLPDPRLSISRRIQHHLNRGGLLSSRRPAAVVDLVVYLVIEIVTRTRLSLAAPRGPWR
jgi:glycosyltransferase involved in cell wall biosynthesis